MEKKGHKDRGIAIRQGGSSIWLAALMPFSDPAAEVNPIIVERPDSESPPRWQVILLMKKSLTRDIIPLRTEIITEEAGIFMFRHGFNISVDGTGMAGSEHLFTGPPVKGFIKFSSTIGIIIIAIK